MDAPGRAQPRTRGRLPILVSNARLRRLWVAHLISMFGDGLYSVALPYMVYQQTRSPLATAATLGITALPYFVVGMLAGVFVDRWSRRAVLIGADLARAAALVLFPLLLLRGFDLGLVIAMALLLPAASRFFTPAQRASVPGLVDQDDLLSVNALMEGAGSAAYIAGPAAAGVLLAVWGSIPALFIDGGTFVISALLLSSLPLGRGGSGVRRHVIAELREGLHVVWRTPTLRSLVIVAVLVMPLFGAVPALLPIWTQHSLGDNAGAYGLLTSSFFIGALIGSVLIVRWGGRFASGTVFVLSAVGMGVAVLGLGWSHQFVTAALALGELGCFGTSYNVAALSLLQSFSPRETLGRVLAFHEATVWSLRPIGVFAMGALAAVAGVYTTLVALGITIAAMGAVATFARSLRGVTSPQEGLQPALLSECLTINEVGTAGQA
jgi:MFS family permease